MEFHLIWKIVVRYRVMILLLCLSASLAALAATYVLSEKFVAQALVLIRPTQDETISSATGMKEVGGFPITFNTPDTLNATYSEMITSAAVAQRIVESIGLENLREKPAANIFVRMYKAVKAFFKNLVIKTWILLQYGRIEKVDPLRATIKSVQQCLAAEPVKKTYLFRIEATTDDPRISALVANRAAEVLMEYIKEAGNVEAKVEEEFIQKRLAATGEDLAEARFAMREYKEQEGIFVLDVEATADLKALAKTEGSHKQLLADIGAVTKEREEVQRQLEKLAQEQKSKVTVAKNPVIMGLESKLVEFEVGLSELLSQYTPEHPKVVTLLTMIEETKNKIREVSERIVSNEVSEINPVYQNLLERRVQIDTKLPALRENKQALERIAEEYKANLRKLAEREKNVARLFLETQIAQSKYSHLSLLHEDAKIKSTKALSDTRVVSWAVPPAYPDGPIKIYYVFVAFFVSLIMGIGVAFFLEYVNQTARTLEEAEEAMGLPVLGALPVVSGALSDLLVYEQRPKRVDAVVPGSP